MLDPARFTPAGQRQRERLFLANPVAPLAPTRRTRAARRSDPTYTYSPAWERVKVAVAVLLTVVGGVGVMWALAFALEG